MRVVQDGHKYDLDQIGNPCMTIEEKQRLSFVNREDGNETEGTTTQEVIRALIDRTWYCNDCLPWSGNKLIVDHLRMALALHEARAFIRGVEKGEIEPEKLALGQDSHMHLTYKRIGTSVYARMPEDATETGSLNPGVCSHQNKVK